MAELCFSVTLQQGGSVTTVIDTPDAYEGAPTPVTSFLSVGPKAAGMAVLLRMFFSAFDAPLLTPHWIGLIGLLAGATMILGNLAAVSYTHLTLPTSDLV